MPPYEANATTLCEAILDSPIPMREAVSFFKAMDDMSFTDGTDTYLEVHTTNGGKFRVVDVTHRTVRATPGSELDRRGVHSEWICTLDPSDYPTDPFPTAQVDENRGIMVTEITIRRTALYDDLISHAVIREY